jgi:type IV pilus assembly protein PilM
MNKIKEQNVAISVGGYSVIVKPIIVQNLPIEQLRETIKFEAEQYIPFDINDVNLDFEILGEDPENPNQMNILLVAAKKEVVNEYVQIVELAGLKPRVMDVDAFALQNIYEINYDPEDESVALIDVGANKTTLNIVKGTISVLIRDVTLGCAQINEQIKSRIDNSLSLEEAENLYHSGGKEDKISSKDLIDIVSSVTTDWCSEIRRALDFFYQTYPGDHIKRIILSGGGANIKKFRELLAEETSSKVEVIDSFENFTIGSEFDPSYLERVGPQSAICMGLAIRKADDKK